MCPRFLSQIYLYFHHRKFRARAREARSFAGRRIISIGNLSMGGTGKTPLVEMLAREALKRGHRPMVVLRGYKGSTSGLVTDGQNVKMAFAEAGDEAMLFTQTPGLRVAVGRDRASVIDQFGGDSTLIFLDDAFQNPSVKRQVDLVLIDASIPENKFRVFPCGKFREGLEALSRASAVVLTRADSKTAPEWKSRIQASFPRLRVFESTHEFAGLRPVLDRGPSASRPVTASAFCGIGNPGAFFRMLESSGVKVQARCEFADHYAYAEKDLLMLRKRGGPWITTAKDAVRLRHFPDEYLQAIWIADMRLRITVGSKDLIDLVFD